MPLHLRKIINEALSENCTYEQFVTHLEKALELNGLDAPDELQIKTVSQNAANTKSERPKPTFHFVKNPGYYKNQCRFLEKKKSRLKTLELILEKTSGAKNSTPNTKTSNDNNYKNSNEAGRKPKTVYHSCETCGETNHSTKKCYFRANTANIPPPWHRRPEEQNQVSQRDNRNNSNKLAQTAV